MKCYISNNFLKHKYSFNVKKIVLFQTTQLSIKTVPFQTIQFSIKVYFHFKQFSLAQAHSLVLFYALMGPCQVQSFWV